MFSWLVLVVRASLLIFAILGAFAAVRRSGGERSEVNAATRRFLLYWGAVLTVAVMFPALIYDDFRLWHWLFG